MFDHQTSKKYLRKLVNSGLSFSDCLQTIEQYKLNSLFNGIHDEAKLISKNQDQKLADIFEKNSLIELPIGIKASDFICFPPDVLPYTIKDNTNIIKLDYNCSEINGTGFGSMYTLPINQLETILNSYKNAACKIKEECQKNGEHPLIVVANSGRESAERINGEYLKSANSKVIWEKLSIVNEFAEQIGSLKTPCYVGTIDNITKSYFMQIDIAQMNFNKKVLNEDEYNKEINNAYACATISMQKYANKPMVLLGYSRDIVECCNIKHGQPYLFGRPINGFVNDRAALNLSKKENKKLDYKKIHIMNVSFEEGGDKFSTALAREKFHTSKEFKELSTLAQNRGFTYDVCGLDKLYHFQNDEELSLVSNMNDNDLAAYRMRYFRGVNEKDGINGIIKALDDFKKLGMKPLYKPSGSGQSKGIIGYKTGESNNSFKQRFCENLKKIEKEFGKGAGYPFFVMPILKLAQTKKGEVYDLRFAVYQKINCAGNSSIHTIPLVLRKTPDIIKDKSGEDNDYYPTNITLSRLKTGRPGTDFMIPLCREDSLKQVNLTQDQIKNLGRNERDLLVMLSCIFFVLLSVNNYPKSACPDV
ncbi:Hypothetical protein CINCED_3A010875 [Cinara cedri]|uniref:Uncharacterized protein n=1 Tax=Cinara cedri TaxID=506608 RepID=A0A5E4NIJ1_9HEMI|nr:Hypothetical protein CINCED_3A010875 [Cinara cedri]